MRRGSTNLILFVYISITIDNSKKTEIKFPTIFMLISSLALNIIETIFKNKNSNTAFRIKNILRPEVNS
jgi:hypothetical protein